MVDNQQHGAKDLALRAVTAAFVERDEDAVDAFFSSDYVEHGQASAPGLEGLKAFVGNDFTYRVSLAFAEDDLVVIFGEYEFGSEKFEGFDIWRVSEGKISEHWDAIGEYSSENDLGPVIDDPGASASGMEGSNKSLVSDFIAKAFVTADVVNAEAFLSQDFVQTREPVLAVSKGSVGSEDDAGLRYKRVHQVIANGPFVFTRAEGLDSGGALTIFNDLWRIKEGKISAHLSVREALQDELQHDNGAF